MLYQAGQQAQHITNELFQPGQTYFVSFSNIEALLCMFSVWISGYLLCKLNAMQSDLGLIKLVLFFLYSRVVCLGSYVDE